MKRQLDESDYLFDGFAHRPFNEKMDGWRNALPDAADYPSVTAAMDTLAMFEELKSARRQIWELKQELALWKPVGMKAITG